ncbi:hypothetical protein GCM10027521_00870 [Amycolatopsis cihanbeyliensis]
MAISVRTVGRHLAQLGLNRRRFLDPTGASNRVPRRITARWPGHMVHLDVKKVGAIPDGGGWRAHGRGSEQAKQVERAKDAGARTGYTYLHSAVDGFSRLAYTEALPDEKAITPIGFTHRARAFFAHHGIRHIHRTVTDNGACYRAHDFATVLHGARHQRITPYTPRHNGTGERYNRVLGEEFLYARTWTSEQQRTTALNVWNLHYNYHRPHTAAGNQPPASAPHQRHQRHGLIQVIRTIVLDDERAPFVQLAFELYDTGDYTLDELADELYDRGLRTRPTAKHPAKKVSINKLSQMLRDRYYLGYVTHKGEEIPGRHEPLIDDDLFDRVQDRLNSRSAAKERRRVHHHHLKGSLFCGRCRRVAGTTQRMIIQRTLNSKGAGYLYFFCRGRQTGTCDAPHVNAELVEDAVERHYATIRFSQAFIADIRAQIDTVVNEQEKAARLLHQQLSSQLHELDTQEENVIDLAADGTLPQTKVKAKLRHIEHQRRHLAQRRDTASTDLTDAARLIDVSLTLLERPEQLYRRCNEQQRRLLNQGIFHTIYIEDEDVTDHNLQEPFGQLHAIQQAQLPTQHPAPTAPEPRDSKKATRQAGGPPSPSGVTVLLQGIQSGTCSSSTSMVELRGLEPLTPSLPVRCATSCAIAPGAG